MGAYLGAYFQHKMRYQLNCKGPVLVLDSHRRSRHSRQKSPPDSWWAFFRALQGWPPVRPTHSMLMSAIRSTFFPTGACAFYSPSHLQWRPRTRRQSWRVFASPSRQCITRQIDRYRTFYVRRPARDPIQSVNAETECNIRVGHGNLYESLSSENCGGYAQHLCHRQT